MADQLEIDKKRHSIAHIAAAAIERIFPDAQLGVGPVIKDGFYYDVKTTKTLNEQDLAEIEAEMRKIISEKLDFVREEWAIDTAITFFQKHNQPFKAELLNDLKTKGTTAIKDSGDESLLGDNVAKVTTVSVYKTGDFVDLCRGPHVANTREIDGSGIKLTKLAGAYWRGKETNPQMQRVYGVAFGTQVELASYLAMIEEAEKRDHRKLGKELDLFIFSDLVGPGLPMYTPRGTILRNKLDEFVQELRGQNSYAEVTIPHITKKDAYIASGHWAKFADELFRIHTREGHEFAMKPMNCPHHAQIYASQPRSYRDLPIRYRETTTCYRDEQTGELSGINRTRAFTQDDAHVFCMPNQVKAEMEAIWDIVEKFYSTLGFADLTVRLSRHDPSNMSAYLGEEATWQDAEEQLLGIIRGRIGENFVNAVGEAAFYGPKIDFIGRDALGRESQLSTIQLDFGQPEGFGLTYTNESGHRQQPIMIHAAIMGSIDRFLSIYIEHVAGAFPTWLAPEQVRVLPVSDRFVDYGQQVAAELKAAGVRVTLDDDNESLGKRIRNAEAMKVPYTLVVGEREQDSGEVAVRKRSEGDKGSMSSKQFLQEITHEISSRKA